MTLIHLYPDLEAVIDGFGEKRIYESIERVRESGKCNMFDKTCVAFRLIETEDFPELGIILCGVNGSTIYGQILSNWSSKQDDK